MLMVGVIVQSSKKFHTDEFAFYAQILTMTRLPLSAVVVVVGVAVVAACLKWHSVCPKNV